MSHLERVGLVLNRTHVEAARTKLLADAVMVGVGNAFGRG